VSKYEFIDSQKAEPDNHNPVVKMRPHNDLRQRLGESVSCRIVVISVLSCGPML